MDIKIINEMIDELKDSDTTYKNANDLASLCAARDILSNSTNIEKEIDDILPAYRQYVDVKTKYQLNQIGADSVILALDGLCQEIFELICLLYSCTDMPLERIKLQNTIQLLHDKYLIR